MAHSEDMTRTTSLVQVICDAEDQDVVLRFSDGLSAPTSKYDGHAYQSETRPKATLHATIEHATVEYPDGVLTCAAVIGSEEMERVGIDPSVVWTESNDDDSSSERCAFQIHAARQLSSRDSDLTREDIKRAVENTRQDEVLEPWQGLPTVTVDVARTSKCMRRHYESDYFVQYSLPQHDLGELIDVRVK